MAFALFGEHSQIDFSVSKNITRAMRTKVPFIGWQTCSRQPEMWDIVPFGFGTMIEKAESRFRRGARNVRHP